MVKAWRSRLGFEDAGGFSVGIESGERLNGFNLVVVFWQLNTIP
jgi:hypothetical protein